MDYSNSSMNPNNAAAKQLIIHLAAAVLVLIIVFVIKDAVLGTGNVVKLSGAPELAGAISQSLATSGANAKVSLEGVDYKLQNLHYLDNKAWAVATVKPLTDNTDQGNVVLERKDNGTYVVVLGPGTAFSNFDVEKLPSDVLVYLKGQGVLIYEPAS